tara:strand:- start:251 stop:757 length:507 start_codon:yes stop_codon:yes gene_type:complete
MRITRRQLRQIIRESFDVISNDTGEVSDFAPSAEAALNIFKRLGITPIDMDFMEDALISGEDYEEYVYETEGKSDTRHRAKESERMNIDNLLARLDKWAADAGSDYLADNPDMDFQDVGLDLAMNAKYEFKPDEWEALVWHFDEDLGDAPAGEGEWVLYDHIANMMVQ